MCNATRAFSCHTLQAATLAPSLSNPDKFLHAQAARQALRQARIRAAVAERQAAELEGCTFAPALTPPPAYLLRKHSLPPRSRQVRVRRARG
jgi:hypothetical protein